SIVRPEGWEVHACSIPHKLWEGRSASGSDAGSLCADRNAALWRMCCVGSERPGAHDLWRAATNRLNSVFLLRLRIGRQVVKSIKLGTVSKITTPCRLG